MTRVLRAGPARQPRPARYGPCVPGGGGARRQASPAAVRARTGAAAAKRQDGSACPLHPSRSSPSSAAATPAGAAEGGGGGGAGHGPRPRQPQGRIRGRAAAVTAAGIGVRSRNRHGGLLTTCGNRRPAAADRPQRRNRSRPVPPPRLGWAAGGRFWRREAGQGNQEVEGPPSAPAAQAEQAPESVRYASVSLRPEDEKRATGLRRCAM